MSMQKYPNTMRARQATKLFPKTGYTTTKAVKHLRRGWMNSVATLGDKWLLADANRVQRKTPMPLVGGVK